MTRGDAVFTPENDLERAMLQAASEPSRAPEFYRQLLEADLVVLGSRGEQLALDMVKTGAGFFHPLFTSPARLEAYSSDDLPNFTLAGRLLFENTRGAQFLINPRSTLAKTLLPDEISWCLDNFRGFQFSVLKPETYPTQLVKALCVLFASRSQVRTARLTHIAMPGNESRAHIIIGIEAGGDVSHLVEEIFAAAAITNPAHPVDVASLDTAVATHPLHQHILTVEPFYRSPFVRAGVSASAPG